MVGGWLGSVGRVRSWGFCRREVWNDSGDPTGSTWLSGAAHSTTSHGTTQLSCLTHSSTAVHTAVQQYIYQYSSTLLTNTQPRVRENNAPHQHTKSHKKLQHTKEGRPDTDTCQTLAITAAVQVCHHALQCRTCSNAHGSTELLFSGTAVHHSHLL